MPIAAKIKTYLSNPNYCTNCKSVLPFEKRYNKFCNSSCASSYNNKHGVEFERICNKCGSKFHTRGRNKHTCDKCQSDKSCKKVSHKRYEIVCKNCGKTTISSFKKLFCSPQCHKNFQWKTTVQQIEQSGKFSCFSGNTITGETNRQQVKKYLIEKHGHACSICGLDSWMGQPIPLIVDHIDGNPYNHSVDNFRLVCGNCDMQLPTYKARNKGKGRKYRRKAQQNLDLL